MPTPLAKSQDERASQIGAVWGPGGVRGEIPELIDSSPLRPLSHGRHAREGEGNEHRDDPDPHLSPGAVERNPGLLTMAHGGTVFLDEVGRIASELGSQASQRMSPKRLKASTARLMARPGKWRARAPAA